ncbi:hypothetical protein POTOM_034826 [Populus tomentosa]|uniref:NADH dehydrogenase [ubiquinone] 1 beta subcomplex subunit 9 n=1 Tax=Populus tomentosa TaxID=118781 RepID=A0A8X7Z7S9_POPTO|nr:hypothetical protein POTOM_034826 [Populus tomentosa]
MSVAAAGYLARRAAQKERVRILYRRALKDTLNWAVHRHLFYEDADLLRARFENNKHVEDPDTIDRMIADGEAQYNKWRHPDPYIVPWAPGGSKFTRNPTPPEGIEVIYDCSRNQSQHPLCVIQVKADSGHCCEKHRAGGGHLRVVLTHVSRVYSRFFLPEKPVNIVNVVINRGFETGHRCDYGGDFVCSGFKLAKHSSRYVAYSDWAFCIVILTVEEARIHKGSKPDCIQNLV